MGGFVGAEESAEEAANRILKQLTDLEGVYMEQLHTFSSPERDPVERTVSTTYFALIDIHKYEQQISDEFHAEWFLLNEIPDLDRKSTRLNSSHYCAYRMPSYA